MNDDAGQRVEQELRKIRYALWVIATVLVLAAVNRVFRFFP